MAKKTKSYHLDNEVHDFIAKKAKKENRSQGYVMNEIMKKFIKTRD